jgi:hypothetical protein
MQVTCVIYCSICPPEFRVNSGYYVYMHVYVYVYVCDPVPVARHVVLGTIQARLYSLRYGLCFVETV